MSLPDPLPARDADLCARIRQGDERAFRALFERYYVPLCRYGTTLIGNPDASEDVVQGLFVRLWEQRDVWIVHGSVRGYLYQAVHRRIVSEWRATRVRQEHADRERREATPRGTDAASRPECWPDASAQHAELEAAYERAVAALPPRRRQAFELHRQHGLSYREIAEVMGITPRTVELHVGHALLAFRKALAAYLSVALFLSGR